VVIPARNAAHSLPGTLAAVRAQGIEHEVVVVDAASTDDTAAVAAEAGARVVRSARRNRALARNLGAHAATGAAIAFIDADCTPQPGWLEAISACLEDVPLVAGPVRFTATRPESASARYDLLWRVPQERYVAEGGVAGGGNLAVRRDAFEAVGGFDIAFHAGEDTDFCLRAGAAGLAIGYCPAADVSHPAATRLRDVLRRGFEQGASARRIARRHAPRAGRRYWNRPGGLVRPGAALRALGVESRADLRVELVARLDYAARMAGSLWAELVPRSLR
jgi:glycosyltransferase involved in cell wall biosynthesis